jgi:hypothetical protein
MPKNILSLALIGYSLVLQCRNSGASPQEAEFSPAVSERNEKVAVRYLWWPFKSERKGGRIYYGMSECDGVRWETPFPEILVSRPSKDVADIATLRRFFANDSSVRIRMRFGEIPAAILQTKVADIKLSPEDQYNPELAVMKIENAPEIRVQMSKMGIHTLNLPMNMILRPPMPGFIHLPSILKKMTMDEALDIVATTFHGLVETAYCRKARLMHSDITGYDRN